MQNDEEYTIGSLFSGIGGIELGFEQAGFKTEWFVEREPYAKEILKKRFPDATIYDDVTQIDFKQVPRVEILTGGFPCQDISNAGKRAGIEGSRSSLWKYYLKAISEIRPRIAFIENVSALLNRGLSVVLCDLAKVGYDAEWYCLPASSVGANHQRDRIFIITYPNFNGDRLDNPSDRSTKEEIQNKDNERIIFDKCGEIDGEWDVSNSNNSGQQDRSKQYRGEQTQSREGEYSSGGCSIGTNKEISNTTNNRWEYPLLCKSKEGQITRDGSDRRGNRESKSIRGWWATEPSVGRVANGIPNRVDRIKCIGNAVVPQVAEIFAEAIKEKWGVE